ncbi:unnamed protein product [Closterium sp. NIES-54]
MTVGLSFAPAFVTDSVASRASPATLVEVSQFPPLPFSSPPLLLLLPLLGTHTPLGPALLGVSYVTPLPSVACKDVVDSGSVGVGGTGAGGASHGGAGAEGTGTGGASPEGAGAEGAGTGGASLVGAGVGGTGKEGANSGVLGAGGDGTGGASSGGARPGGASPEETEAGGTTTAAPTPPPHHYGKRLRTLRQLAREEEMLELERLELEL